MIFMDLAEMVLSQRDRDGIRGLDRELSRWRCHIATASFAAKDVKEIVPLELRAWLRTMAEKPALGPGPKRTLSRQTISRCTSLVSAVLQEAVERDYIPINPCLGVKLKRRVDERDCIDKWAFLTWLEQCQIAACQAIPYEDRLMIAIAAHTGMRQGEMRHIELSDVVLDPADPHITVRIAGRDRRDKTKKLPTKSGKSRIVPLLPPALDAMKEWLGILPVYAPSNPEGVIFPTREGKLRQSGKFFGKSDTLRGYYRAAGIKARPYLHHHALRHTYATNLITGVYGRAWRKEEIQLVMGHSSVTITERYAHLGEDAIRQAARETVAAMRPPPAPDTTPDLAAFDAMLESMPMAVGYA